MESKTLKAISSGREYDHLIPKARLIDSTVKRGATVSDTVRVIPQVVREYKWQAKEVALMLKGETLYDTCSNIWHFLYEHVKYKKDEDGIEQVRTFSRLWHDRFSGVDCDCFTTSVLCLLAHHNIKGVMRITKYKQNHFQHIYVIVPTGKGDYITIDCVVDKFDYEEPYSEKKDFSMDLQILNGIEDDRLSGNVDAQEMLGWGDDTGNFGELGKLKFKMFRNKSSAMAEGEQSGGKKKKFQKLRNFAKKALNITNKLNPATALLRAGILASMKLNIMKVPERLKWAYLTADEARAKGADMSKFDRLKKILTKMEGIFYTAGGNPENLKKAILGGRGNRNKEVNGLYGFYGYESDMSGVSEYSTLPTLLGATVYQDEFVNGLDGTDGLGSAVASGAAIASATTVMTAIAALLKSVGGLFPKKDKGGDGGDAGADAGDGGASADASGDGGGGSSEPSVSTNSGGGGSEETSGTTNAPAKTTNSAPPATTSDDSGSGDAGGGDSGGGEANKGSGSGSSSKETTGGMKEMWEKNKKWAKPLGIGLGVATVIYFGYRAYKNSQSNNATPRKPQPTLNGFGRSKRKRTKGKSKRHHHKKSMIALM